ncbi:hypothetical protein H8D29_04365 [PVC group bacterium]|nr:hypothetical protein [PVC group bacterium]
MNRLTTLVFRVEVVIVLLWVFGRLLSDQWYASQWLLWIPTLAILTILLIATVLFFALRKKCKAFISSTALIAIACCYLFIENNLLSSPNAVGDIRIVAWTMSHSKKTVAKQSADDIIELDADITILTHGWYVRGEIVIREWLGKKGKRLISGPFTLLTKLRPVEVRTLVASDQIYISMFVLGTKKELGKHLVLYAVDLPSSINRSRMETAKRAKKLLGQVDAPPPDIVIGDFNMTRNSASIKHLFPDLVDAWDRGGIGWSSSYHRAFPLYHIDHSLINNDLKVVSYELIDPKFGRHCIQLVELSK